MKNLTRIAIVLLASFAIHNSYAQSGDSTLKGMNWRNIGPNRGGRSLGVAGSSKNKLEYYFGAVGGGLWKTTDGGLNWKPVTDGQLTSSSVGAVAVAETNPVIYSPVVEKIATLPVPPTPIETLPPELTTLTLLVPLAINVVSTPNSPTYL